MRKRKLLAAGLLSLFAFSAAAECWAEIINQGDQIVRLSGRRKSGVSGSITLQPGQTMTFADDLEEVSHVPSGRPERVNVVIIEPDGRRGAITSLGGRYTLGRGQASRPAPDRPSAKAAELVPGEVLNRSNIPVFLLYRVPGTIRQGSVNLQPDQNGTFPKEAAEVTLRLRDRARDNDQISVYVTMPDGSRHVLNADGAQAFVKA